MSSSGRQLLRKLPSVDEILRDGGFQRTIEGVPRRVAVQAVRAAVDDVRQTLVALGREDADEHRLRAEVLQAAGERIGRATERHYRKVINATGIILHTGLGRAVLPEEALRQIQEELAGYSLLQADVGTGRRSKRDGRIEELLRALTGAEAATVVNNNAAATFLVLHVVAAGKEVIVSRGQLVEIGGSFRLPEVMAASGARLVEVGTTNRTHARDYRQAITDQTAAILRVHPSNYRIFGFTAEVPLEELAEIAHGHGLVLLDDVGAGPLVDVSRFGFPPEPTLPESVRCGADLITGSADKLIGACQGGIILGRADLVGAIRKSPLARILRVDKLTLAVLEATLKLFLDPEAAMREIPTLRLLRRELAELDEQARRIAGALRRGGVEAEIAVIDGASQMGSGSLPAQDLPTRLVALHPKRLATEQLAQRLRRHRPPVFARIHQERLLVDPRTLLPGDEEPLIQAITNALAPGG